MKSKPITIKMTKDFAKSNDKDMAIIVCWDRATNTTWVSSWGKTIEQCESAAKMANNIRRACGFPEEKCHETPARVKKMGANYDR